MNKKTVFDYHYTWLLKQMEWLREYAVFVERMNKELSKKKLFLKRGKAA